MVNIYLFDTGFITLSPTGRLPEKWIRSWREIQEGFKNAYIIEPIIAEVYYQLLRRGISKEKVNELIIKFKSVKGLYVKELDNDSAFLAGYYRAKFRELGLSLADCLLLATGYRTRAKIHTTDEKLKIASNRVGIFYNYLPIK